MHSSPTSQHQPADEEHTGNRRQGKYRQRRIAEMVFLPVKNHGSKYDDVHPQRKSCWRRKIQPPPRTNLIGPNDQAQCAAE